MQIVYSPNWFFGEEIVIDVICVIVLALLAIYTYRCYKFDRSNKKYLHISIAFLLLDFSFLFKILTNFTIYYFENETRQIGFITLTYQTLQSTDALFFIGYLAYRILTLTGLYFLFLIYYENKFSVSTLFTLYLIIILTYFSQDSFHVFHFTSFILLLIITLCYIKNYRKNKNISTKLLALSFILITLSHFMSLLISYSKNLYAVAEIIQLIGYGFLLITFMLVLKNGKEKRKN